jgi:hypothetical protein
MPKAIRMKDFAETFAVWLDAGSAVGRERYRGWPVMKKLDFMERLMSELADDESPVVTGRQQLDPLPRHLQDAAGPL